MKGIILAGGSGTRLFPVTQVVCKQLLPVYDKPMVYYPLSTLMLAGITEILIISTPLDIEIFRRILSDGRHIGLSIEYAVQETPRGLADAFIVGEKFIGNDSVCLILGDNIFYGNELPKLLISAKDDNVGATVFAYYIKEPEHYGIVEFDENNNVISIEEKPRHPKSNYAVVGLYMYDNSVVGIAKSLRPSERGEIEITDVNKIYLENKKLKTILMGRGFAWLDTGTHNSMLDAASFVRTIEERQGLKISCIEEIAYRIGLIDRDGLRNVALPLIKSSYGKYLMDIVEKEK